MESGANADAQLAGAGIVVGEYWARQALIATTSAQGQMRELVITINQSPISRPYRLHRIPDSTTREYIGSETADRSEAREAWIV